MSDTQDEVIVTKHTKQRNIDNAKETQTKVERLKWKAAMKARDKTCAQNGIN